MHAVQRHNGVRTKTHKLIHFYNVDEWELYDLEKDPDELRNVVEESQYAEVVAELKGELKRLQKQYQVPEDTTKVPGPGLTAWPEGQRPGARPNPAGRRRAG